NILKFVVIFVALWNVAGCNDQVAIIISIPLSVTKLMIVDNVAWGDSCMYLTYQFARVITCLLI
ncbi:hypothetical protein L9F63_012610, partial [Diploptera punctata]